MWAKIPEHRAFPQQSLKQEFKIIDPVRNYKMANTVEKGEISNGVDSDASGG